MLPSPDQNLKIGSVGRFFFFFFFLTYRERVEFSNIFFKVSKWGKLGRNAVKTHTSAFLGHWIQILANSSPKSDIFNKKKKKKKTTLFFRILRSVGRGQHYTDGDFWRREHHGMFLSRGLKWYWGKIISPETKSRDLYSSRNIISNPKILGTIRDVPDNKVAICYIVWLPIALPGFGIARRNLQNSVFFSAGISFKLCAVQCVSIVLCAAVQRVSIVLCAQ